MVRMDALISATDSENLPLAHRKGRINLSLLAVAVGLLTGAILVSTSPLPDSPILGGVVLLAGVAVAVSAWQRKPRSKVAFEPVPGHLYVMPRPAPKAKKIKRRTRSQRTKVEREIVATDIVRVGKTLTVIRRIELTAPTPGKKIQAVHTLANTLIQAPGVARAQLRYEDKGLLALAQFIESEPMKAIAAMRRIEGEAPAPESMQRFASVVPRNPHVRDWELIQLHADGPFTAGLSVVLAQRDPLLSACQSWHAMATVAPEICPTICLSDLISDKGKIGVYGLVEGDEPEQTAVALFITRQTLARAGLLALPVTNPRQTLLLLDPVRGTK